MNHVLADAMGVRKENKKKSMKDQTTFLVVFFMLLHCCTGKQVTICRNNRKQKLVVLNMLD
jgi:hypothetical protein